MANNKSVEINGTPYAVLATRGDIILVHLHDNRHTPFVVWRQSPDGACHGGDYCSDISGAVSMFETRR